MFYADFRSFFQTATGHEPFAYQKQFAEMPALPILIAVLTGLGKFATVVLGWLWRRFHADPDIRCKTPLRLIYCLPTRTLVEQAYEEAKVWLEKLNLNSEVNLELLMGGAVAKNWDLEPEKPAIIIGTQDQLVSRALNRGYAMSRYRWPIQYAQLNNDVLWVMDEVQLMGIGASTTAQLQGFREQFGTYGHTHSIWMSATLDPKFLDTPDFRQNNRNPNVLTLTETDEQSPVVKQRLGAVKMLRKLATTLSQRQDAKGKLLPANKQEESYAVALAKEVAKIHEPNILTLVICNRVSRAQAVYQVLKKLIPETESITLIHSRFRLAERRIQNSKINEYRSGKSGILVTTQAVEAGVDISAKNLITELAPWSALVQRFGRCNRKGEYATAFVYWVDIPDLNWRGIAQPYTVEELKIAREQLEKLEDVGLNRIREMQIVTPEIEGLIPRKTDILELFDTSVDLAGHDIDVSRFIRNAEDLDVQVAWREWEGTVPPQTPEDAGYKGALQKEELCSVRVYRIKEFLEKVQGIAWVWDGEWTRAQSFYPGQRLLLHCSLGGYSAELGFTGNPKDKPAPVELEDNSLIEPDGDGRDPLSFSAQWESLQEHSTKTAQVMDELCQKLHGVWGQSPLPKTLLCRAAQWHDAGKAHEEFQKMLRWEQNPPVPTDQLWAKAPPRDRQKQYIWPHDRRGFRHELVSALMALQNNEDFLLAYLVVCHHGKVRMNIQPRPHEIKPQGKELYALGVHEGDCVSEVDLGGGVTIPSLQLTLKCMQLGADSWTERAYALLEQYGPFKLAFLEMLVRITDWRASTPTSTME